VRSQQRTIDLTVGFEEARRMKGPRIERADVGQWSAAGDHPADVDAEHAIATCCDCNPGTVTNFRWNFAAFVIFSFAVLGIVVSSSTAIISLCALAIGFVLARSYFRTIKYSFSKSRFLVAQTQLIDRALKWSVVRQLTTFDDELHSDEIERFTAEQQNKFTTCLGANALLNRVLYFWAYQLDRYRRSAARPIFAVLSYIWLFLLTVASLSLVNTALIKIDPRSFDYQSSPSSFKMVLYSLSSLALNGVPGLEPSSDTAIAVKIAAGLLGPLLVTTLLLNVVFAMRRAKEQADIQATVGAIKERGKGLERQLVDDYGVPMDEALRRLAELGVAFVTWTGYISARIPPEFYE
jgi:hypothetical protein